MAVCVRGRTCFGRWRSVPGPAWSGVPIYGLGAGGQAGVSRAIEIMRDELDGSMALTGTRSVREVGRAVLAESPST